MKFLLIQTAFIGDVILATSLVEKLHDRYPDAQIDFLVRKGNEGLLKGHPFLRDVLVFDKAKGKYRNLFALARNIRAERYDYAINVQRFLTTGLITAFSGAKHRIGFEKNPLSWLFSERIPHEISTSSQGKHEIERNHKLIQQLTDTTSAKPKLYPSDEDFKKVERDAPYICLAPSSVWFTKQLPAAKWVDLANSLPKNHDIILIGGKGDQSLCEGIKKEARHPKVEVLAGALDLLQSAALIKNAQMTYTNDSAPAHLASAMNAPVTVVFCSTVPSFGFGPLSEKSHIAEVETTLNCRPCGLHGKRACPLGHFNCAKIDMEKVARKTLAN